MKKLKVKFPIVKAYSSENYALIIEDSAGKTYSWNNISRIQFPVVKSYSSEVYALIIEDSSRVYHYWTEDGSYDGYSADPTIDCDTGINMN